MGKIKYYVAAMRLRTIPLSLAGVSLGIMLAAADYRISWQVVVFILLTTVSLQLLSNVSNELGDYLRGTDSADRKGPCYSLTTGKLGERDFKGMIVAYILLSAVSGLAMIWFSFGTFLAVESLLLIVLGLGDLYVFLFFGIVSVMGAYFVASHAMFWKMLLPASCIGAFSVAVLNVNNIRDMSTDAATRVTIPLKIGEKWAKVYQTGLIVAGWVCMIAYSLLRIYDIWHYLFVLTLPLFIAHLSGVWKRSGNALDPMLPLLVMSTFLFSLLAGFGYTVFLL